MGLLASQLHLALPLLSSTGRTVIAVAADAGGHLSAESFAATLGLKDRHRLARALRHEGLPQLEELYGWMTALNLLLESQRSGQSLYSLAIQTGQDPPTCYRAVKRVTGKTWRQVCAEGFDVTLVRFVNRCGECRCRGVEARSVAGEVA